MKRFDRASVTDLAQRVRELRRRHFGARGKAGFAERIGVNVAEYETYERGAIPPPDVLVRMCAVTGEDLQWLLTGVASRGTMVITGALDRHQALLARVARMISSRPERANAIEAFVELLEQGDQAAAPTELPAPPRPGELIPVFDWDALPRRREDLLEAVRGTRGAVAPAWGTRTSASATFAEPSARPVAECACAIETFGEGQGRRRLVRSAELGALAPACFGVQVVGDDAAPLILDGDVIVVSPEGEPRVGHPALCRLESGPVVGVWLGRDDDEVILGRLSDGLEQHVAAADLCWCGPVTHRVRLAA